MSVISNIIDRLVDDKTRSIWIGKDYSVANLLDDLTLVEEAHPPVDIGGLGEAFACAGMHAVLAARFKMALEAIAECESYEHDTQRQIAKAALDLGGEQG